MAGWSTESFDNTLSGAKPEIIYCSRHNDGEPFELQKEKDWDESTDLLCTDLERIISARLMRLEKKPSPATAMMNMFKNRSTKIQMQDQIFLCPRRDVAFLKCLDMSPYHKIRTILGIPEDHQCTQVEIVCYQAKECKQQQQRPRRIRPGPHSDWMRVSTNHKNDLISRNASTKISWIDLRKFQRDTYTSGNGSFLSTEAGVVQFLRSVLTPSHDASPWNAAAQSGKSSEGKTETYSPSADIVVLVLNYPSDYDYENDFSLLKKFRVSDAAPSWFLHGFSHLEALEPLLDEALHKNLDKPGITSTHASTLLIYKKLGPRPILYATNPAESNRGIANTESMDEKTGEATTIHSTVEEGCLWEEYEANEDDDECHEQKMENDDSNVMEASKEGDSNTNSVRYRLVSPPYLNLDEEYHGANLFAKLFSKEALRIFTEDALSVPQWTPWPETAHYKVSSFGNEKPWTVFPICHCFPANKPDNFTWIPMTKSFVPRTCRLLEEALRYGDGQSYLRTALFSQMAPRSVLEEHTGWSDLANHVLRLHIPLVVPNNSGVVGENDDLCGTWVDGCVETHAEGRPLLFDDSKTHRAFNYSDCDRIVLIVDLARPTRLPLGTAESGHTEELDSFIAQMSVPK
mmetsp:Transcript_7505/g.18395  ORF Transcript_7505/g.18395 Transcript_7505/m.18395 type:complete len:631 (+) Transcript_7505:112-2004(+)|eukprot:CAMPEP_0116098184 /NCGR_PEP_ID=MMETSP0327-20121206/11090_1 /TAXON_ID=44447 /ORGANISM="Pseudo-nitzschia delicatissima, Strain B596" /LENGTH=630 /DNA_ID=CAMNT_0003589959 /DNA_START=98 /DNA_END=1990 /DNA_ORIENTATION=+